MRPGAAHARSLRGPERDEWNARAARLFAELESPAKAMVRRAYRGAFGSEDLDDIYNGAWVGTLRALAARHRELSDGEIRSYVFTAVAHQAGKEIRRRRRRPTAPLDRSAAAVADGAPSPDERVDQSERSRLTRDLLASLPRRRRAVLMLRYGWGLQPAQVCAMIEGLSPRAYRKEITRGIDELTERLKRVEAGEWCADREPILKAYAAGTADPEQRLQAQQHLSHCRECSSFVARLSGQLHDLGGALAVPGAVDALAGERLELAARLADLADRVREPVASALGRGGLQAAEPAAQLSSAGRLGGTGAAGAGVLAKLAGLGSAGKIAVACLGGGAATAACLVAGVAPFGSAESQTRQEAQVVVANPADGDGVPSLDKQIERGFVDPGAPPPRREGVPPPQVLPQPPPEPVATTWRRPVEAAVMQGGAPPDGCGDSPCKTALSRDEGSLQTGPTSPERTLSAAPAELRQDP